jgi:hypothetical protein
VSEHQVIPFLIRGRIEFLEDDVQILFEQVLGETFHKNDYGGEENDLYTTNVRLNGRRIPTAFLLKGRGVRSAELRIADCGENGDQLVRLVQAPAELFIVQFVGPVSESVIKDIQGKANERRLTGKPSKFCIIDGTDTTRMFLAYDRKALGDLNRPSHAPQDN